MSKFPLPVALLARQGQIDILQRQIDSFKMEVFDFRVLHDFELLQNQLLRPLHGSHLLIEARLIG